MKPSHCPPDRKNVWAAENVMGWLNSEKWKDGDQEWFPMFVVEDGKVLYTWGANEPTEEWAPDQVMTDAWMIVERMAELGYKVTLDTFNISGEIEKVRCQFGNVLPVIEKKAPLAILNAAIQITAPV